MSLTPNFKKLKSSGDYHEKVFKSTTNEIIKQNVHENEEGGVLTEAFTIDGDPGMMLYGFVSPNKTVKGAVFI